MPTVQTINTATPSGASQTIAVRQSDDQRADAGFDQALKEAGRKKAAAEEGRQTKAPTRKPSPARNQAAKRSAKGDQRDRKAAVDEKPADPAAQAQSADPAEAKHAPPTADDGTEDNKQDPKTKDAPADDSGPTDPTAAQTRQAASVMAANADVQPKPAPDRAASPDKQAPDAPGRPSANRAVARSLPQSAGAQDETTPSPDPAKTPAVAADVSAQAKPGTPPTAAGQRHLVEALGQSPADDAAPVRQASPTSHGNNASQQQDSSPQSPDAFAALMAQLTSATEQPAPAADSKSTPVVVESPLSSVAAPQAQSTTPHAPAAPPPPPAPPEIDFAQANHARILASIRGQLLPDGGTMQIRLDPPELGALQIRIEMHDGAMTASFQTSNDQATRLLSHSLDQLKQSLETQGMSVDKLQVQQAPRDQQTTGQQNQDGQPQGEGQTAQQEQQRREMLQRMWRRLSGAGDPVDLMA